MVEKTRLDKIVDATANAGYISLAAITFMGMIDGSKNEYTPQGSKAVSLPIGIISGLMFGDYKDRFRTAIASTIVPGVAGDAAYNIGHFVGQMFSK